jgi:hypothetical protein
MATPNKLTTDGSGKGNRCVGGAAPLETRSFRQGLSWRGWRIVGPPEILEPKRQRQFMDPPPGNVSRGVMLVAGGVAWAADYEDLAKEFRAMDIWGGPWCPVNNWNVA